MACGIHLGFLLICLIQAEHVRCSWAPESQSYPGQSGNTYAGLSQINRGRSRLHGNDPQNKFRQASISPRPAQSSSFHPAPVLSGGSKNNQIQTAPQPPPPSPHGGHSVRYVQSSKLSRPNWATAAQPTEAKSPNVHKKPFPGVFTDIASASSVAKYSNQNSFNYVRPKNQPGTQPTGQYVSSSAVSVKSPSGKAAPFASASQNSHSAARRPPSTAATESHVPSAHASKFFRKTSATVRARRVSSSGGNAASKPSRFSPAPKGRSSYDPRQRYRSSFYPVVEGPAKGVYPGAPAFGPRSLQDPATQGYYKRPGYAAPPQSQSSVDMSDGPSQSGGSSSKRPVPSRVYNIPQSFGGYPIRRRKKPAEPKKVVVGVQKPQQKQTEPSQQAASYNPQGRGDHNKSRWVKVRVG